MELKKLLALQQAQKQQMEASEKANHKHNLEEKVKLAEKVKMKAIAEADKVK